MTGAANVNPLDAHDSVLGPTAKAHHDSPPQIAFGALACRALGAGIPTDDLLAWCLRLDRADIKQIAKTPAQYEPLLDSASARVASSSSLDGRAQKRVTAARRLVVCLLSPMPAHVAVSSSQNVGARHALAAMGPEFLKRSLDDGYDSIVMGGDRLATLMGVERKTADRYLDTLETAGWIRRKKRAGGLARAWRLPRLSAEGDRIAWAHSDLVNALTDRDLTNPFVEVFFAASHPAVGYGEKYVDGQPVKARVGGFSWLVGLLDEAGVDPVDVGMTKRTVSRYRKAWLAAVTEGDTITEGLDAHGAAHGSDLLHGIALDAYHARAYDRTTGAEAKREVKGRVHQGLATLLAQHTIPKATARFERRNTWTAAMTSAVSSMPDEMRPYLAKALASKMRARRLRYSPMDAVTAAAQIAGAWPSAPYVLDALLGTHEIPALDAESSDRDAWVDAASTSASALPEEMRHALAKGLSSKLEKVGYEGHVAAKVAARVAGLDAKGVAA